MTATMVEKMFSSKYCDFKAKAGIQKLTIGEDLWNTKAVFPKCYN